MQAHYIKEWRKHRGMTQLQLAEAVGVSRPYLSMIERGDRRYDQPFLEHAAKALGVPVADLVGRHPDGGESIDAMLAGVSGEERARIEAAVRALIQPDANKS